MNKLEYWINKSVSKDIINCGHETHNSSKKYNHCEKCKTCYLIHDFEKRFPNFGKKHCNTCNKCHSKYKTDYCNKCNECDNGIHKTCIKCKKCTSYFDSNSNICKWCEMPRSRNTCSHRNEIATTAGFISMAASISMMN